MLAKKTIKEIRELIKKTEREVSELFPKANKLFVVYPGFSAPEELGKRIAAGEDVEILPQHLRRMNQQGYGYSMKRCRNCGFSTTEDFEYCPKCGTRLSE